MSLHLESLSIARGSFRLEEVNLELESGAYGVLMGRTGCGKSSLLETIAGLLEPDSGRIWIDGQDVTNLPPAQRGIGYVPQDGALFSTMTVAEQLGFAPRIRGWSRAARRERVAHLAAVLGIEALLERRPAVLSGGERQRVALGRALAARPGLLLLDEPLSAIDEDTREGLIELLRRVRRENPVTVVHVTHNRSEAARLATDLFVLEDGRVHPRTLEGAPR